MLRGQCRASAIAGLLRHNSPTRTFSKSSHQSACLKPFGTDFRCGSGTGLIEAACALHCVGRREADDLLRAAPGHSGGQGKNATTTTSTRATNDDHVCRETVVAFQIPDSQDSPTCSVLPNAKGLVAIVTRRRKKTVGVTWKPVTQQAASLDQLVDASYREWLL